MVKNSDDPDWLWMITCNFNVIEKQQ